MEMYAVLYSKFSPASQRFLAMLDNVPTLKSHATLVCVDNRQVRDRVMNHPKLQVQEVPCVIRIFADTGYTELFEGEQAFALAKNMIKDVKEEPSVASTVPVNVNINASQLPGPKLPQQMSLKQHMAIIDTPNSAPLPVVNEGANPYVQIAAANPVFEEIPSKPAPPTGVSSTYLNEIEKENMQRAVPERTLKSNTNSGGNLITRAQQMQKERDAEMSMTGPGMRAVP